MRWHARALCLTALAIVAGMQDRPAEAARLIGIDEARDRIVEIDTASGEVRDVVAGDDVRAERIIWSPDESFAYLLDPDRDRILVYDPETRAVSKVIPLSRPLDLRFSPSGDRAYVAGCGTTVIDTERHEIVDVIPSVGRRSWQDRVYPWAVDDDGIYSIVASDRLWVTDASGAAGRIHDLDLPGYDAVGLAPGDDRRSLFVATSRAVSVLDKWTGSEIERLYFHGPIREIAAVPGADRLVVVTSSDVVLMRQSAPDDRIYIPCDEIQDHSCYPGSVELSGDGAVVVEGMRAFSTIDGELLWQSDRYSSLQALSRDGRTAWIAGYDGSFIVRDGHMRGIAMEPFGDRHIAWRERDQSFYVVDGLDLLRVDTSEVATHAVIESLGVEEMVLAADGRTAFFLREPRDAVHSVDLVAGSESVQALADPLGGEATLHDLVALPGGRTAVFAYQPRPEESLHGLVVYDGGPPTFVALDEPLWGSEFAAVSDSVILTLDDYDSRVEILTLGAQIGVDGYANPQEDRIASAVGLDVVRGGGVAYLAWNAEGSNRYRALVSRFTEATGVDATWGAPWGWRVSAVAAVDDSHFLIAGGAHELGSEVVLVDIVSGSAVWRAQLPGVVTALRHSPDDRLSYVGLRAHPGLVVIDEHGESFAGIGEDLRLSRIEVVDAEVGTPTPVLRKLPTLGDVVADGDVVAVLFDTGDLVVATSRGTAIRRFDNISHEGETLAIGPSGEVFLGIGAGVDPAIVGVDPSEALATTRVIPLPALADDLVVSDDGGLIFAYLPTRRAIAVVDVEREVVLSEIEVGYAFSRLVLTSDGVLALRTDGDALVLVDTTTGAVWRRDLNLGAPVAGSGGLFFGAHHEADDGIWRLDPWRGEPTLATPLAPGFFGNLTASGDGKILFATVQTNDTCGRSTLVVDGDSGELSRTISLPPHYYGGPSHDGARYYFLDDDSLTSVDTASGEPMSSVRLPLGELIDPPYVERMAVGCAACVASDPLPRAPWADLPTATPTPVRTPTPTPTPDHLPYVEEDGYWFVIGDEHGAPGETLEIGVGSSAGYRDYVRGVQLDLRFPPELQVVEWRDGQPDCEYNWDWDWDSWELRQGRFEFLPWGCDPARDCSGVRAVINSHIDHTMFRCRVRIDPDAGTGVYEIGAENLLVNADSRVPRLQVVPGYVTVHGAEDPTPTPTPYDYRDPTAPSRPRLKLKGRNVETDAGWVNEVPFSISGSASTAFSGLLRATLEAASPLGFALDESGELSCTANPELVRKAEFTMPDGCEAGVGCARVAVRAFVDGPGWPRGEKNPYEDPGRWLYPHGEWLFRCDVKVDAEALDGQYYVRVLEATFRGDLVDTEDVLIDTFVPWYSPTATATPTATGTATPSPRPRLTPRPCVAEEGTSIICIDDLEADAGDQVELTVHYRSGGVLQVGLEFVIELGKAFAPIAVEEWPAWSDEGRCHVNREIKKNATAFSSYGGERIKALILSFDDVDPLPDDVRLATCTLDVAAGLAPGEYEIHLLEPGGSDPDGNPLPVATRNGYLRIRGEVAPSTTPTPAPETPTATSEPTSTPQANTRDIEAVSSDSGCQISEPRINGWAVVILLLSPISLLLRRRVHPLVRVRPPAPLRYLRIGEGK